MPGMKELQIKTGETAMWSYSNSNGEIIFGSGTFAGLATVTDAYGDEVNDPNFENLARIQTSQKTLLIPVESLRIPRNGSSA